MVAIWKLKEFGYNVMKYMVSRCPDGPKRRELKGCSAWSCKLVDTKEEALKLAEEWEQEGFYIMIEEIEKLVEYIPLEEVKLRLR